MEYLVTSELTIMLKRFRFFIWLVSIPFALMLNTTHAAFSCGFKFIAQGQRIFSAISLYKSKFNFRLYSLFIVVFIQLFSNLLFFPAAWASTYDQELLQLTNAERAKYGLSALTLSSSLGRAAQKHAESMATENYFSHTGSDGSSASDRAKREGYSSGAGENISAGRKSPSDTIKGWMNSSGHRANILNATYTEIGFGHAYGSSSTYGHYWVQVFGSVKSSNSGITYSRPTMKYPTLNQELSFYPSGLGLEIQFSWNNNNLDKYIKNVYFSLVKDDTRETVGACKSYPVGIKEKMSIKECNNGNNLKPTGSEQRYKWSVYLKFKDGQPDLGFPSSGYFTLKAIPKQSNASQSDLTISQFKLDKTTVETGERFKASATTKNIGNATVVHSNSISLFYMYSSSPEFNSNVDFTELSQDTVNKLASNATENDSDNNSIKTAGTYYVRACVEPVDNETNKSNNCSDPVKLIVISEVSTTTTTKLTGISTNAYIKSTNPMIAGVLITSGSKEVSVKASTVDNILKPRLIIKTFPAGEILYEGNNPKAASSVQTSIILPEGLYTMEVYPVSADGQGIIEIYEAIAGEGRLQGISTNAYVKSTNPMIAGVLVEGGQKQVLVKATSIDQQIIPLMRIKAFPSGTLIAENLNSASSLAIQETVTLNEGLYTMEIYPTGVDGQAIIEVYEAQ